MARKALLIGAQAYGLGGVEHDVRSMTAALGPWDFAVDSRVAEAASRAGILDACENLIAEAGPDDSILVYFSGLGGTSRAPGRGDATRPPAVRYIVPTDFDEAADRSFRGITAIELSSLLRRMSEKAGDVAAILDCCFDARSTRTPGMGVKALGRPAPHDLVTAHLDALLRDGVAPEASGSPVIRIAACAPGRFAYEYEGPGGKRIGRLTDGLVHALPEAAGVPTGWSAVVDRVRRHLAAPMPGQRPVATGPLERALFDRRPLDPPARIWVAWSPMPVRLPDDPRAAALADAVAASRYVRAAVAGENGAVDVAVTADNRLVTLDRIGALHAPRPTGAGGVRRVVADLDRLGRAAALRSLAEDPGADVPLDVEIGLLDDAGDRTPLPGSGAVVFLGQRMYLRVHHHGEQAAYVSAFGIDVAGRIRPLTGVPATGYRVDPGTDRVLGDAIRLGWPAGPDGPDVDHARPATMLVVASSVPRDLDVLGADPPVGDLVRAIDVELVPTAPPRVERTSFQVDERPDVATRLLSAARTAPAGVDIRVTNMVAHHNRTFRHTEVRLDAVTVTMGADGRPFWWTRTERFAGVHDGARFARESVSLYRGPVRDQLDLSVWISADRDHAPDLADLLATAAPDVNARKPGGRRPWGPVRVAYAAIDVGASVVDACDRALRAATGGDVAPLCRTALPIPDPGPDRSDAGRPVRQNMVRAQDFSFTYTIEPDDPDPRAVARRGAPRA